MEKNCRKIMNCAESLENIKLDNIGECYKEHSMLLEDDVCNLTVTFLGMCVNKELALSLSDTKEVSVEEFPNKLNELYEEILNKYVEHNKLIVKILEAKLTLDSQMFLDYLNNMVKVLLSGVKYIEKKVNEPWYKCDEQNEWNTRYRREERVRDKMKSLFSDEIYVEFTIKNGVELPYMYVLAWDLPTLLDYYDNRNKLISDDVLTLEDDVENRRLYHAKKTSYIANLPKNTSNSLRHISDNMLDILLNGMQFDEEKFVKMHPDAGIEYCKQVSYIDLLPTIKIVENVDYDHDLYGSRGQARENHIVPLIKKEILQKIPLLPMELPKNRYHDIRLIKMMVDVLKEENKTKDYLDSDIVALKENVVDICEMMLNWIFENKISLRIEREKAKEYLIHIIECFSNLPRKEASTKIYFKTLIDSISKKWHEKNLRDPKKIDNNYPECAYFSVLKLFRNWNLHELLKEKNTEIGTFVVFVFIISLRYIIEIDKLDAESRNMYFAKEMKFFRFFDKKKVEYNLLDVDNIINKEYEVMYVNVEQQLFVKQGIERPNSFPEDNSIRKPHTVLNIAGKKEGPIKDKLSEDEIYLTFWLSIHVDDKNNVTNYVLQSGDVNLIRLLEYTFNYQKNSFLLKEIA